MQFSKNREYKRSDIQKILGGELQSYLPQKNGIILAACLSIESNPDAPYEVQVGNAPKVVKKAELLSNQPETRFPVFIKNRRADKIYKFIEYYRFKSLSRNKRVIEKAEERSSRYGELAYILHLIEA
ncbi:MAG: hypothetical protein ACYCS8_06450 [Acidithiobacillus sp.]